MKKKGWLWLALAAALCVAGLVVALNWTAIRVKTDPLGALESGVDDLPDLPNPLSVNLLGAVELGGQSYNCAGRLDLQADADGLRFYLADCTLGNDSEDYTFFLYADPTVAAASLPDLFGDTDWYSVDLTKPLTEQADLETLARFDPGTLEQAQQDFDNLRDALSAVHSLNFEGERQALWTFLEGCEVSTHSAEGSWFLCFAQTDSSETEALCQGLGLPQDFFGDSLTAVFMLNKSGTLCGVSVLSDKLSVDLDLGAEPTEELAPRLEADWGTGSATLALAFEKADPVTAPSSQNIFALLGQS